MLLRNLAILITAFIIFAPLGLEGKQPLPPKKASTKGVKVKLDAKKFPARKYIHQGHRFGFDVPAGWQVFDSQQDISKVIDTMKEVIPQAKAYIDRIKTGNLVYFIGPEIGGLPVEMMISIKPTMTIRFNQETLKRYIRQRELLFNKPEFAHLKLKITFSKLSKLKGVNVMEYETTKELLGIKMKQWHMMIPGKGRIYSITCVSQEKVYNQAKEQLFIPLCQSFEGAHEKPLQRKAIAEKIGNILGILIILGIAIWLAVFVLRTPTKSE